MTVLLLDGQPAPLNFLRQICNLQLIHIASELAAVHGVGVDLRVQPVPFWGGQLLDRHRAEGDALQGAKIAGRIGGQLLCDGLAAFLVANLVYCSGQRSVALGSAAGLGVLLLELQGEGSRLVLH